MKIATWNVNSVRARLQRIVPWLLTHRPDVLCMQELKVEEKAFPRADFEELGYHVAVACQKTYNGIGILSRFPMTELRAGLGDEVGGGRSGEEKDDQARVLAATIAGIRVISAYFPNGQSVGSDKWTYKLRWMERLREDLVRTYSPGSQLLLCGDFNVAPDERDVYEPATWTNSTLFHTDARNALAKIQGFGFVDLFRKHHPEGGLYSWWDYRMLAFVRGKGLRIDHLYATPPLAERCTEAVIDKQERKEFKGQGVPSDHAPVVATFTDDDASRVTPVPPDQGSLF